MKPIHPLVKAARDRRLPHPAQLDKFHQMHWIEFMHQIGPLDVESTSHISGATWLNNHFHSVANTRKQISFNAGCRPDYQEMIRAHIASANYAFWQVHDEQQKIREQWGQPAIEQMLLSKTTMVGESDPIGVNRVNMHRLDSLRGPLFELFRFKDRMHELFPDDRPVALSRLDFYLTEMRMSQHFHSFSSLWQELLFGHTVFAFRPGKVFFVQRQADYHRIKTVAEFRRDHFILTSLTDAHMALERLPDRAYWVSYLYYEVGKPLSVCAWEQLSQQSKMIARFQPVFALSQLDDHLKKLLVRQQRPGIERTLQSVVDVWVHLSVLAVQIDENLHTSEDIDDWAALIRLAPLIDRTQLIASLCQCCEYNESEIMTAVDLLTWKGKSPQEDLWAQPLVAVEEQYVFPVSAFLTASLTRNIDCWMGKIDPKDTRRGKLFEQDLVRVLEECRNGNLVMKENLRYTSAVEPNYHGNKEEIDLTFSFGNALVVVEARSRKTSITPLDYENEMYDSNGLVHKTKQAIRKTAFVREHLVRFTRDYYPHLSDVREVEVIPLVIVNGQFHAGYPLNGVPVIDPALLMHFLRDREVRFMASPPYDKHQYGVLLWESLEEAQARFWEYVCSPAMIKTYNAICCESEQRSDNLGPGFEEVVTLGYEMEYTDAEAYIAHLEHIFPGQLRRYY